MSDSIPSSTPSRSGFPWKRLLFFAFSVTVTVGVFRILFTRIDWQDVVKMIREISVAWVGVFLVFSFLQLVSRTWRYAMVLKASGENPPPLALFLVVVVRGLCVDMLPARAGELVYIFLVRTRLGIDLGAATASFALAFLFDVLALGPLVILGAWAMGSGTDVSPLVLMGGGVLLLAVSLLLIGLMIPVLRWGSGLLRPVAEKNIRWAGFLCATADSIRDSLELAKAKNLFWKLLGSSLIVRVCKYASLYALMLALLVPQGVTLEQAAPAPSFIGLVSGEMAASLPVSGLGGFGAYEGTMSWVLTQLDFDKEAATAMSISHRLLTQTYGLLLGVSALLLLMLPVFRREDGGGSAGCGDDPAPDV